MFPPDQSRERRQTVDVRDPERASTLLFANSRLVDVAVGRAGIVVDALRLTGSDISFGRVVSVGHEVVLEDPDHVTILIPTQGHIAMEIGRGEHGVAKGTMAVVRAEKRRTRVIAPKDGMFVATTVLVARYLFQTPIRERASAAGRSLVQTIDTPFGRKLQRLLPDLADDVFRQNDRLFSPRARDEFIGLINDLMADCAGQEGPLARPGGGISEFRRVSQACDIIQARSGEALSLTQLAAELQITPRCLQLSFEAVKGMSPRDYLQQVRLERVRAQILAQGDRGSVTRAAMECGFLHLGRFPQMYRRAFGELPSETLGRRGSPRSLT